MKYWMIFFSLLTLPLFGDEMTLSIIKPNAVEAHHIGAIISRFEENQLKIAALKMIQLNEKQASLFYQEHKDRPFYSSLITFMTRGPVVVMVLKGEGAIAKNREIMGATDPQKAEPGTIRKDFASSVTENAVHGSDSPASAKREIDFFFSPQELFQ